jgi:hypothetical protein
MRLSGTASSRIVHGGVVDVPRLFRCQPIESFCQFNPHSKEPARTLTDLNY